MRQRRLATDHGCAQVHLVQAIPGFQAAVFQGFPGKAASHVDQAIDAAEMLGHTSQRLLGRVRGRQINAPQWQQILHIAQGCGGIRAIEQCDTRATLQQ
ncbi:hypothetical protein D3C86_1660360 [compost metagenome]